MPPPAPNNDPFGVPDDERALVPILDEFDKLLAAGQDPKVEEFLGRVPQATQRLLLLELVLRLQFRDKTRPRRKWNEFIAEWPLLQGWTEAENKLRAQQDELEASDLEKTFVEPAPEASPIPKVKPIQNWERRFQNVAKIGEGGFGTVYRGLDTKTGNDVAIKVVDEFEIYRRLEKKKKSPAEIRKQIAEAKCTLEREVQSLRNLHHPNIVPLLDFGFASEPGQDWFLVYPFIDGGTLRERLKGPLDAKEAIRITIKLARALHCAHQRKFLHLDIKPENILLDSNGEPYLADFGLALSREEILGGTLPGGTKWYLSKEQVEGKKFRISPQTDIYSLGVVLYEMLAGQRPIKAPDKVWREAICEQIPDSLWVVNPRAPSHPHAKKSLEAICSQALKKEPEVRFANAEYLADQLQKVLPLLDAGTQVPPPPPPPENEKPKPKPRTLPKILTTGVMAAAVLVVAVFVNPRVVDDAPRIFDRALVWIGWKVPPESHPDTTPPKLLGNGVPIKPILVGKVTSVRLNYGEEVRRGPAFQSVNLGMTNPKLDGESESSYTAMFDFTATTPGSHAVELPEGFVVDLAGNRSPRETLTLVANAIKVPDQPKETKPASPKPPPVLLSELSSETPMHFNKRVLPVVVKFSNPIPSPTLPVSDLFEVSGEAEVGATFDNGSWNPEGTILSANLRVERDGDINIKVQKGVFQDEHGTSNEMSPTTLQRIIDTQSPTLTLFAVLPVRQIVPVGEPLTIKIVADHKDVVTLSKAAIELFRVPNATLLASPVPLEGTTFQFQIRPDLPGEIVVVLADGFSLDRAGNPSSKVSKTVEARRTLSQVEATKLQMQMGTVLDDKTATGQPRTAQMKFADGNAIHKDLVKRFDGIDPMPLGNAVPKWVWEGYCFLGAIEMDLAGCAYDAKDNLEARRFYDKALASFEIGRKAIPKTELSAALLELLTARCKIDMAVMVYQNNPLQRNDANKWLSEAEKSLSQVNHSDQKISNYRLRLERHRVEVKSWINGMPRSQSSEEAEIDYYDLLRRSIADYWKTP